jgi:hypothetical protein
MLQVMCNSTEIRQSISGVLFGAAKRCLGLQPSCELLSQPGGLLNSTASTNSSGNTTTNSPQPQQQQAGNSTGTSAANSTSVGSSDSSGSGSSSGGSASAGSSYGMNELAAALAAQVSAPYAPPDPFMPLVPRPVETAASAVVLATPEEIDAAAARNGSRNRAIVTSKWCYMLLLCVSCFAPMQALPFRMHTVIGCVRQNRTACCANFVWRHSTLPFQPWDAVCIHTKSWHWQGTHLQQGSQPPPGNFDQLVEGPWQISTRCPPGGLCGGASAFWREIWSRHPLFRAQNFDQLVEDLSKISEDRGLRPLNFDPSMRLRALTCRKIFACCIHRAPAVSLSNSR